MIHRELGISKSNYQRATQDPYSFIHIDKPRKFISKTSTKTYNLRYMYNELF